MSEDIHAILPTLFESDTRATILEVGCHFGHDSLRMRDAFPQARIICFEPDPRNIYTLKKGDIHRSVTLVEAAVSDADGHTTMHLSSGLPPKVTKAAAPQGWTASSSIKKPIGAAKQFSWLTFPQTARVRTVRLDTFCAEQGIGEVGLIWADVQGAEAEMIAGAQHTLSRTRYLFTEFGFEGLYEGEIGAEEVIARLPGSWKVLHRWSHDMLLRNTTVK